MGVYYRVATKCDHCFTRKQVDTKCWFEAEAAKKQTCCGSKPQVFDSVAITDWSDLAKSGW
jgi:hypothetical protein